MRWRYLTVLIGIALFVGSILQREAAAVGLPAAAGHGALAAGDRVAARLAARRHPGGRRRHRAASASASPEVRSVFIDGGRIPPATTETRKASLIINYMPKSERSISQSALEQAISRELASVPDIRYWFLDENGQRDVTLIVKGANARGGRSVAAELAAQMRRVPLITNVVAAGALERPELRIYAAQGPRRRASASRPKDCRRRSGSQPSATSVPRSRGSMPATGSCRSACC